MGTRPRTKPHLLLLLLLLATRALVSSPAWNLAQGSPAAFGPVFEDQPLGLLFPEESTEEQVTLVCRARASPPATYRWKMNGTEMNLGLGSRHQLVGGNLVIMNPTKAQDAGVYQCLASNPVGTVVSREAVLRFGFLQEFSKEERDPVKAHEGWGVMLPCNPPAHYPGLSYRWLLNEFPNFIPTDGRHFVSQTTGNLYIARTNASDLGNYSCLATSHMDFSTKSVFSKFAQLNLAAEDPRLFAPSIKARFPAETYALVGQQVTLECFAFGNPVPRIKWRKVDGSLSPQWATAEPTLQIPSVSFEDEGTYECEAENSRGRDTVQGRIIVQAQPEWLKVISDTEADIGANLRWGCAAAGKPRPTVRWLRNGEPLASQGSAQNRVEVSAGDLRFSKLSLEDSGMYQCVAENKHGTIYASAELAVQALAPDFRQNPVRRLIPAARGGEISIACQPRAAPKATVLWSKGTEILVNSSRLTVTPDGTLVIRNISRSDEGRYTCFAENFMGKANSTGVLSVRDATKITLAPSSADINLGDNLTLQCHASHDPTMDLTFTWTLDDFPIDFDKPGGHYRRASVKETVGDLTILSAQLRHGGTYECMAQTVVDSASKEATVLVRGPPGPPGGVVVRDIGDTTVQLSWSRGFDNHSPIAKYTLQARTRPAGKWKQVRTNPANIEGNAETAQVLGLTPWMDYEFRVLASNILGTGEPSGPSSRIRTKEAVPSVAPSGLGGGGGAPGELIVNWTAGQQQLADGPSAWRRHPVLRLQQREHPALHALRGQDPQLQPARGRPREPHGHSVLCRGRAQGGPHQGLGQGHLILGDERDLGACAAGHERGPPGVRDPLLESWGQRSSCRPSEDSRAGDPCLRHRSAPQHQVPCDRAGLQPGRHWARQPFHQCNNHEAPASATSRQHLLDLLQLQPEHQVGPCGRPPKRVCSHRLQASGVFKTQGGSHTGLEAGAVRAPPSDLSRAGWKAAPRCKDIFLQMLYQNDLHPTPILHLTSKNWIEIPMLEDTGHALVQIRTTGPGGDGIPAEVHIVRNGGTSMMVENAAACLAPHPSAILSRSVLMLILIGYLEL
ncbi:contactin-2 isoform X1 [Heterocephalus glaber]|uniref:Contactin-2 n=1 Tax=Heterocephalus glaber TaxID=10181 RepID=A0AAX6RN96_HETGA|nr:contactin-2 isoform X1 [Heterocephalus glaber]XP_021098118.1 contactin-2 isoform X1 [Heterocephalus glaber]